VNPVNRVLTEARRRALAATVTLAGRGGRGVLVPGGFILTAAHCVDFTTSGEMATGEEHLESVITTTGATFRLSVHAVEPVADIAVLGEADDQVFVEDAERFGAFCDSTLPVPVSVDDFEYRAPVRVLVLSLGNKWIAATAMRGGIPDKAPPTVGVEAEDNIRSGMSGGPFIDEVEGTLVGIVSWSAEGRSGDSREGVMPRPHLALPRWAWHRIAEAQRGTGVLRAPRSSAR
jgi:hypothetical protein